MPMYEFHCNKCNVIFEELASADEKVSCPKCGSADTERLMSACAHCGCGCGSDGGSSSGGGGCAGCSGGHCASCGH